MSNKTTVEHYCSICGVEYMVTWDEDNTPDEPIFCPFCATGVDDEELDFNDND